METKPSVSYFILNILLLFSGIAFIFVVFGLYGLGFVLEFMALLIFLFSASFGMLSAYQNKTWGWMIVAATLVVLLLDTLLVVLLQGSFKTPHIVVIIASVIGIIISVFNVISTMPIPDQKSIDKKIYYEQQTNKIDAQKAQEPKPEQATAKFVASKNARKFHSSECDWAKRISNENKILFATKEEAQSKGFEPDKCIV